MPFSIHHYLRQARHLRDDPQFPVYGDVKKYPRMPSILLSDPVIPDVSLTSAMQKRRSFTHDGGARLKRLDITDVSNLLGLSLRKRADGTRPYPSGGGFYPIETYVVGTIADVGPAHVYHYDPSTHALADLWPVTENVEIEDIFPGAASVAPACIILTGMWGRNGVKYGDFGYYLGMLEAGHIGQNILLAAAAFDMSARPMGGFNDAVAAQLLDINENLEQVVYAIMLGKDTGQEKIS